MNVINTCVVNAEIHQVPMLDDRPVTPPSQAVQATRKQLTPKSDDSRMQKVIESIKKTETEPEEDSFVNAIGSRTPRPIIRDEHSVIDEPKVQLFGEGSPPSKEDSFLEKIVSRSPAKSKMRIEDSVEAIDALEDALEQIDQALPKIEDVESPTTTKKVETVASKMTKHTTSGRSKAPIAEKQPKPKVDAVSKTTTTKKFLKAGKVEITTSSKKTLKAIPKPIVPTTRVSTRKPSATGKEPGPKPIVSKEVSPPVATATSDITAKMQPLTATVKAPFQPVKSTKPPTRPAFELPGEAISRKLKEQREQRLRLEEAEKQKKREFKARPIRLSQAPVVKPTATSKARASLLPHHAPSHPNNRQPHPIGLPTTHPHNRRPTRYTTVKGRAAGGPEDQMGGRCNRQRRDGQEDVERYVINLLRLRCGNCSSIDSRMPGNTEC